MADNYPAIENFRIDPNQYLGHDYEDYLNQIKAMSLVDPKGYINLRNDVARKLKRDAVKNLYNTMFDVLQKGVDGNNRPLFIVENKAIVPRYMLGQTNEFVLSASETMDNFLKELLQIVLPREYTQLTEKSLGKLGNSSILNNN